MRGTWFKMYNDAANHPKLQALPSAIFRGWFNVVCIASIHDGTIPDVPELARWLHIRPYRAQKLIDTLIACRLVDQEDGRLRVHNWDKWQAPHKLARFSSGNTPNAPKSVQVPPGKSNTWRPPERKKDKKAVQNENGRSEQHLASRKRNEAHSAWERELRRLLGDHYAMAIDRLAADPALVDRITAAELRKPGSGVMEALNALGQIAV